MPPPAATHGRKKRESPDMVTVLAMATAGLLTAAVGFIAGALWSSQKEEQQQTTQGEDPLRARTAATASASIRATASPPRRARALALCACTIGSTRCSCHATTSSCARTAPSTSTSAPIAESRSLLGSACSYDDADTWPLTLRPLIPAPRLPLPVQTRRTSKRVRKTVLCDSSLSRHVFIALW
jgi:hypothetical protein